MALAAQGFGGRLPAAPGRRQVLGVVARLGMLQIDSVNVLARAHYLPGFSRLGAYNQAELDEAAWGRRRALFEYWGHEASLLPLAFQPLLRWRMERARAGRGTYSELARFARERPDFLREVLAELRDRGPLAAAELTGGGRARGGWWGWSDGKRAMEYLFWTGEVAVATRRSAFERLYDLPERVLPRAILATPTPAPAEAQRALVLAAAAAMGVATAPDLRAYFRLDPAETRARIAELAEAGDLQPIAVEGWRGQAWLHHAARLPRHIDARALLSPFDPLIWERDRVERLFGFRYRIEIYTPAHKRAHGYYVLPFLLGDRLVARVDLKADRAAGVLRVPAAHREAEQDQAAIATALLPELQALAAWQGLERVEIGRRGDLAAALSGSR